MTMVSHTLTYTHPHMLTLTAEREASSVALTESAENIADFLELCRRMALALGYAQESWEEAVTDAADMIIQSEQTRV